MIVPQSMAKIHQDFPSFPKEYPTLHNSTRQDLVMNSHDSLKFQCNRMLSLAGHIVVVGLV